MRHLERALFDQNDWWRYLLNFLISFLGASIIGSIPLFGVIFIAAFQGGQFEASFFQDVNKGVLDFEALGLSLNTGLFLMLLPFVLAFVAFILCMRWFHRRNWVEVINGTKGIRWRKYFTGFAVWLVLSIIFLLVSYYTAPQDFELQFSWSSFIPLFFIAILLLPLQTAYEELLFRGYLAQGIGAWKRNRILAILLPSLLFGLMHVFNPEVQEYGFWYTMPQYIGFGVIFGLAATLDDGIETAMGAHAANNIFLALFITSEASALQTHAVFKQVNVHPESDSLALLIYGAIFLLVLTFIYKWDWSILGKKITVEVPSESEQSAVSE